MLEINYIQNLIMATTHFDWIPFYTELAQKLLEYKNRRDELIEFMFAEDGLRDYSDYLHLQDKTQKIDDIDPFSFIGMFNRGKLATEKRRTISQRIKDKFNLKSAIPFDFDGIPVLNYMRMYYFHWDDFHKSCNDIWGAFESMMNGDLKPWFNFCNIAQRKAESTIPLYWCKPNSYISLDSRNCDYLKKYNIDVKVNDVDSYLELIKEIQSKMTSGEIQETNFPEISFNAWNNDKNPSPNMPNENSMNELVNLLRSTHNLILTGAPGTGKTLLAKQIAKAMGCTDDEIKFVQFHPSYDYTDFVEGLRPIQDENGNVGFERKDGVFKEFCKKAINGPTFEHYKTNAHNSEASFDSKYDWLITHLRNRQAPLVLDRPQSDSFKVTIDEKSNLRINDASISKELFESYFDGTKNGNWYNSHFKIILEYIDKNMPTYQDTLSEVSFSKPFVFIIDEINRGEISKIFGELFFSIDPGYRGEEGRVQTQYQNLVEDGDVFKKGFYVPENVYIIGTMNDIDRSVESMDFAFRRRFAFKEIKADENVGMLDTLAQKDEAIKRMKSLNAAIEKEEGLSSAYHIGASYFLKLNDYNGDFDKLWDYHLEGLLREYLRGMTDVDAKIEALHKAYDNEADSDSGQQQ